MSSNSEPSKPRLKRSARSDRRVVRTRDTLGDALIALMQETPFDDITVQQVLDRAGVGRSTFYMHYRHKDDLFLSDVEEFWESMASLLNRRGASGERVAPVRELFAHVADVKDLRTAFVTSGKLQEVLELGRGVFSRSIEDRLMKARVKSDLGLLKAHAHALAGSLFALLDWWIDHDMTAPPEEMDALFHRIVWTGMKPGS